MLIKEDSRTHSIIHELGHALGLSHEQDRPDAGPYRAAMITNDKKAEEVAEKSQKAISEGGSGYVKYGNFDPDSIMIYPTPERLSPSYGDFLAIAEMYNRPDIADIALAKVGNRAAAALDNLRKVAQRG